MHSKRGKKRRTFLIIVLIAAFVVAGFFDTKLTVTNYTFSSVNVPTEFDGYRILHISDLHHKNFGVQQAGLIETILRTQPDIIVMTGDIVDEEHSGVATVEDLLAGIQGTLPIYYVTGNHEMLPEAEVQYAQLLELFAKYSVVHLRDSSVVIRRGASTITLTGIDYYSEYVAQFIPFAEPSEFNVLLYHGSNNFDIVSEYGYDLVFSGHGHGGIIRLPIIGGIVGNDGSLFPEYEGGMFVSGGSTLISSRGLGDALLPRFYNPPELVLVTLER